MLDIFVSASGVGKSTLSGELLRRHAPDIRMLTSTTTRAPRDTDLPEEYEYVAQDAFEELASQEKFLEPFSYKGNRYGTLRNRIDEALKSKNIYIAILVLPAAQAFMKYAQERGLEGQLKLIFLDLKNEEERLQRLVNRGETDPRRSEEELAQLRAQVEHSELPFLFLDASLTPHELADQVLDFH